MPNINNFNSIPIEIQNFNTTIDNNKKNIDTIIPTDKTNFDIVTEGFGSSITSRSYFRQYNTINIGTFLFGSNASAIIIIEPVIISASFGGISLRTSMSGSFLQYNNISAAPLLNQIAGSALFVQNNTINAYPVMYANIPNTFISTGSIFISACPIALKYYMLSDWDGSSLSSLDSLTLQQMDYQIV